MVTTKQAERTTRILQKAFQVFCRDGFQNANMDEVSRNAGVGKGTIYRHYRNKEGLFFAVFDSSLDRLEEVIRGKSDFRSFEKGGRMAIRTFLEEISQNPETYFVFQVFFSEQNSLDCSLRKKLADRYLRKSMWAIDEIRVAQARKEIRSNVDPEQLIYGVLGMIHLLIFHWIQHGKSYDLPGRETFISDILFQGIKRKTRKG